MALRDVLVFFGVEVDQKPLEQTQVKVDTLIGAFRTVAGVASAFGAVLAGHALVNFIRSTVKAADDVGDMAARLGLATDEFQILQAVADDAGTSMQAIQTAFRSLAAQLKDTGKGAGKEFNQLGVATKNADGSLRSVEDVFWDTGTALAGVTDQATRYDLAQKLMGRAGLQLLPIFAGGADAVAKYRAEVSETAVVFDEDFINASDRTEKNLARLHHRFERIRVLIVSQLLPAFNWLVTQVERLVAGVSDFIKSGKAMQLILAIGSTFILRWAAGIALTSANFGTLAVWVARVSSAARLLWRFLLRFALPVLIIDELITLFRGGDTLIGRFIDKLFGIGAAAKFVESVKVVVQSLVDTIASLFSGTDDWEMAFLKASEGIGKVFDSLFEWIGKGFDRMLIWIGEQIVALVRKLPGGELIFGKAGSNTLSDDTANPRGALGLQTGSDWPSVPSIAPRPSLSSDAMARRAQADGRAAPQVTNNITVEGNATSATAREIGQRAGSATGAALGRDRAAIGAAVGVGS
jgi:hypothetical protein